MQVSINLNGMTTLGSQSLADEGKTGCLMFTDARGDSVYLHGTPENFRAFIGQIEMSLPQIHAVESVEA